MRLKFEVSSFFFPAMYFCSCTPEHKLSGDVLCLIDSEGLKAAGITSIGQRLAILKAIYLIKVAHDVPIEPEDYVPQCVSHPSVIVSGAHTGFSGGS